MCDTYVRQVFVILVWYTCDFHTCIKGKKWHTCYTSDTCVARLLVYKSIMCYTCVTFIWVKHVTCVLAQGFFSPGLLGSRPLCSQHTGPNCLGSRLLRPNLLGSRPLGPNLIGPTFLGLDFFAMGFFAPGFLALTLMVTALMTWPSGLCFLTPTSWPLTSWPCPSWPWPSWLWPSWLWDSLP